MKWMGIVPFDKMKIHDNNDRMNRKYYQAGCFAHLLISKKFWNSPNLSRAYQRLRQERNVLFNDEQRDSYLRGLRQSMSALRETRRGQMTLTF